MADEEYEFEPTDRDLITPEEFYGRMRSIEYAMEHSEDPFYDKECAHMDADSLMAEVLTQLGYGEGVEVFKHMPKWYA